MFSPRSLWISVGFCFHSQFWLKFLFWWDSWVSLHLCSFAVLFSFWPKVEPGFLGWFPQFLSCDILVWQILGRFGETEIIYRQCCKSFYSDHWILLSLNVLRLPCHRTLLIGHFLLQVPGLWLSTSPFSSASSYATQRREIWRCGSAFRVTWASRVLR